MSGFNWHSAIFFVSVVAVTLALCGVMAWIANAVFDRTGSTLKALAVTLAPLLIGAFLAVGFLA